MLTNIKKYEFTIWSAFRHEKSTIEYITMVLLAQIFFWAQIGHGSFVGPTPGSHTNDSSRFSILIFLET